MAAPKTYLLTLKESRAPTPADETQLQRCGARILERVGRTVKVEVPEQSAEQLAAALPGWHVQSEVEYRVPDTRRFVRSPPPAS